VRIYKVGLSFPLEPTRMREFARGLDEMLVIEEKGAGGRDAAARHVLQRAARCAPR
jgi:TPP-dependent indolepyruvate ferredoxin oxidoreductase alpha subunit